MNILSFQQVSNIYYENIDFTNSNNEMNTIIYAQNKFEDSILYTIVKPV